MGDIKLVVFTDLDGTLLDARDYSFEAASGALGILKSMDVPVVFCTSKTRPEILHWRERTGNIHPFISENGGGVYIPPGYFGPGTPELPVRDGYLAMEFGTPYPVLREALASLKAAGFDVTGFGDMTVEEVAELTGLSVEGAGMAKEREFDEPFVHHGGSETVPPLLEAIRKKGLNFTEGRLMHILGDNDKGKAVRYLTGLYRNACGEVATCGIGDSPNDGPLLDAVDYPFLVRKAGGLHDPGINGGRITRVDGIGPYGWSEAVMGLLKTTGLA